MSPILAWSVWAAFAMFSVALLLTLYRLVRGPTTGDRILALDTLVINAIAMVILFDIQQGTDIFFEAAVVLAAVAFITSVALAKFVLRGDVIE